MDNDQKTSMLPIGPLMVEHRLIERMAVLLKKEIMSIELHQIINACFLEKALDFFRFYADRCHHGKEEGIFFKRLQAKQLSPDHVKILTGLFEDHAKARELVEMLNKARQLYLQKDARAAKEIKVLLKKLVQLYTEHIQKEDKQFFIPSMQYFTKEEQAAMLCEFEEFDKMLIHEKYKKLLEKIEGGHYL